MCLNRHGTWSKPPIRDTSFFCFHPLTGVPCLRFVPRRESAVAAKVRSPSYGGEQRGGVSEGSAAGDGAGPEVAVIQTPPALPSRSAVAAKREALLAKKQARSRCPCSCQKKLHPPLPPPLPLQLRCPPLLLLAPPLLASAIPAADAVGTSPPQVLLDAKQKLSAARALRNATVGSPGVPPGPQNNWSAWVFCMGW